MLIRSTQAGSETTLHLEGRFDFHSHRDFRLAAEQVVNSADSRSILVNFAKVDYLDSSALGMLLLLREKAEAVRKTVSLAELKGTPKQVLEIANFGRLFRIL